MRVDHTGLTMRISRLIFNGVFGFAEEGFEVYQLTQTPGQTILHATHGRVTTRATPSITS